MNVLFHWEMKRFVSLGNETFCFIGKWNKFLNHFSTNQMARKPIDVNKNYLYGCKSICFILKANDFRIFILSFWWDPVRFISYSFFFIIV